MRFLCVRGYFLYNSLENAGQLHMNVSEILTAQMENFYGNGGMNMALHRVMRNSVSDQVIAQMKENIETGTWLPGQRLPGEIQLCEIFGTSRVTVRNALQKLAGEGLIETRAGDGSYVRKYSLCDAMSRINIPGSMTEREFRELLEFRCVMEGPLCGLAVSCMTGSELKRLSQCYDAMCLARQDEEAFAAADVSFHATLASCCGNQILEAAYQMICANLSRVMKDIVHQRGKDSGLKYHKAILDAAKAHDAAKARAAMEQHMQEMARELPPGIINYHY